MCILAGSLFYILISKNIGLENNVVSPVLLAVLTAISESYLFHPNIVILIEEECFKGGGPKSWYSQGFEKSNQAQATWPPNPKTQQGICLYKFVVGTSKEQVMQKGIRQKTTKEWTHSLTAVPFVRGHRTVSPRSPRNTCVYTRHPAQCHGHVWRVDTATGQTRPGPLLIFLDFFYFG